MAERGGRTDTSEYIPTDFDFRIAAGRIHSDLRQVQTEEHERADRVTALLRDGNFADACEAALKTMPKGAKVTNLKTRRQARRYLRHQGVAWAAFVAERQKQELERETMVRQMEMDNRPVAENLPHGVAGV